MDLYCYVLQQDMLQKYIDLVKIGKTNDEQILSDFSEEYFSFLHKGHIEIKKDRKHILEIFRSTVDIDRPMEKLIKMNQLVSKSLLGNATTLDSEQVINLINDTIQAKKDLVTLATQPNESCNSDDLKIETSIKGLVKSIIDILADPELYHTLAKHFKKLGEKQGENHRTKHIAKIFNTNSLSLIMDYQHSTGQSETKKSAGTIDFAVLFNKEKIAIGEAVNSSAQNTDNIDPYIVGHLKKLTQNYNHSTLSNLIVLVYYEGNSEKFYDSYCNYRKHFAKCTEQVIKPTKAIDDISSDYVVNSKSIKIAKSIH